MEKTLTALFNTAEELDAAREAAFAGGAAADSISVCRATALPAFGGKSTVAGTVSGAAIGLILGLGAMALENMGVIATVGPVAGLISGAVIGAIVGGFMDYEESRELPDERWLFTVSTAEENTGSTARRLKKCGGDSIGIRG